MVISVFAASGKSLFTKRIGDTSRSGYGLAHSNLIISFTALIVIIIGFLITGYGEFSAFSLLLGVLFAAFSTTGQILHMQALGRGKISVAVFIYSCGFLLPTLCGVLIWKEPLTVTKTTGILMLLVSLVLCIIKDSGQKNISTTVKPTAVSDSTDRGNLWYIFALCAMFCSGMLGILQKVLRTSPHGGESGVFLTSAFSCSVVISIALSAIFRKNTDENYLTAGFCINSIICGLFAGIVNIINLALAGMAPATICFPVINGGNVILSAIIGVLLYRERPTIRNWIGIGLGIIAIFVISR